MVPVKRDTDTQHTFYVWEQVPTHHKLPPLLVLPSVCGKYDVSHPATSISLFLEEQSYQTFRLIMMRFSSISNAHFSGSMCWHDKHCD